ncbi:MAG TPA: hypothetical protein VFL10_06270 [Ornithinibacter sp.]|nr:hypothetical protein [Ornithinibacter sp.]
MRPRTVGLLVVGVVAALVATGCGSADPPAGASSSGGGSASGSASASASPSSDAKGRATAATTKALLPAEGFAKIGLKVDDQPETTRWDWFDTCRPTLPSESRQVVGTHGTWKRQGFVVSQTVVAYPDGVAEQLVAQVEKAVDCRTYATREGTWSGITTLDLPDLAAADAQYAWCMTLRSKRLTSCHSVVAAQDLVSSLWVLSEDAGKAKEGLAALTGLAARRIEAQVS